MPISALNLTWYTDEGVRSTCAEHLTSDNDQWRGRYWENFYQIATTKSKDWSYENEYRLILNNIFGEAEANAKGQALKYEFKSLKGIVFGIKTSVEEKHKIIEIIEKKCDAENRDDFKFYQASYSTENKCIEYHEINSLKFVQS